MRGENKYNRIAKGGAVGCETMGIMGYFALMGYYPFSLLMTEVLLIFP